MVKYSTGLDDIFASLSNATRRDILQRVSRREMTVSDISGHYGMTMAAVSKHLRVLEHAHLIAKRRLGKQQFVRLNPAAMADADEYLRQYQKLWEQRFDRLEAFLKAEK